MKLEKDLIKQIDVILSQRQLTGEVEFSTRLNSGTVKTYYGSYVKLCKSGTPDFLALVRGREDKILALFIEAKSDTGRLRQDQEIFKQKYGYKEGFWFLELRDINELIKWFDKYAKDFVELLPGKL
jgi:hypothetical protein